MSVESAVAGGTLKLLSEVVRSRYNEKYSSAGRQELLIDRHLARIEKWSSTFDSTGLGRPQITDDESIGLFSSPALRFGNLSDMNEEHVETAILDDHRDYILLGEPGAGKTTTVKRLARKLLQDTPVGDLDKSQYPLVIELGNLHEERILYYIAKELNLSLTTKDILNAEDEGKKSQVLLNEVPLDTELPKLIDATRPLIFLDGLDEVPLSSRKVVERDIEDLRTRLAESRIVVTCRSGDWDGSMSDFNVVELSPLTSDQIRQLASLWCPDPDEFLDKINVLPYKDACDRPLLLSQLITLNNHLGYLPKQPSEVYDNLTRLLLDDWNRRKRTSRESKYSGFFADKKMRFLSSLAFDLLCRRYGKTFDTSDLIQSYKLNYRYYGLPADEAQLVAKEIQSHTGIIVEAGLNRYSFSHLSLMEYLAAFYLLHESNDDKTFRILDTAPSVVAILVALNNNPGAMFAKVVLESGPRMPIASFRSFVSRLFLESPDITKSEELGHAFLSLLFQLNCSRRPSDDATSAWLDYCLLLTPVRQSLCGVLTNYTVIDEDEESVQLISNNTVSHGLSIPVRGRLPTSFAKRLLRSYGYDTSVGLKDAINHLGARNTIT